MKLPLWVYDYKEKKYKVFPWPEMLTTLSDGSVGLKFEGHLDNYAKKAVFLEYRGYFEFNPIGWPRKPDSRDWEYRLKRQ